MVRTEQVRTIMQDIKFLSSDECSGRLSATEGALKTAQFLAQSLQEIGYAPMGKNGFFSVVNVPAARLIGPARLVINGHELQHRIDFAEWLPLSSGGSLKEELITVRDDQDIPPDELGGKIVLIPDRPEGFDVRGTIQSATQIGIRALLIESGDPRWFHKTVFGSDASKIPVFRLRRSIADQYANQSGIQVEIDLPIETKTHPCRNVIGFLPGKDTSKTLLLSAHYDHLGDDPGGLRFPGSVDNASGVAVMLEVARQLANRSDRFAFNILVAFLTGEESGLWGARELIANPPVPITAAINLDCLGFEPKLCALRVGHRTPGHWLADLAAGVIENHGVEVKWIAGGDDSVAFLEKGISAIGLGQKPTLQSSVNIHTAEDDLKHIHEQPIQQGLTIITEIMEQLVLPLGNQI